MEYTKKEELIELAKKYCLEYHKNQKRKDGSPYHLHPFRVCDILKRYNYNDSVTQCVALLHDVFEDTSIIIGEIKREFGYEIANGVYVLSRNTISLEERDVILKIMGTSMNQVPKDTTPREIVEKLYKIRLTFAKNSILRVKIADTIDNTKDLENLSLEGGKRKIEDSINFYIPLGKVIAPEMVKELEDNVKRYKDEV